MVKHLLKKYHYPSEGMASAIDTVMRQCEMWTDTGNTYFASNS